MRAYLLLLLICLRYTALASKLTSRDYDTRDYYVLHLKYKTPPNEIADRLSINYDGQLGKLKDHHIFSSKKQDDDLVDKALKKRKLRRRFYGDSDILDDIQFAQKQKLRPRLFKREIPSLPPGAQPSLEVRDEPSIELVAKQAEISTALNIKDPIFKEQWHLLNLIQPGNDVNVTGVWLQGVTGKNTTVAIVDDGLDMYSDDLKENYFAEGSYDFNDNTLEPKPRLSDDRHGTRCAGEVAAVRNNVCGVGVAWEAKVAGIRILSKLISDADEAVALNYAYETNHIYSCSWGPPDDGKSMDAPGILIKRSILNAIQNGRGGLGSIYVFASGNGGANQDNCNFDGYTNSIYSITVGAIDRKGLHPYYSEKCSAHLVVTYSSGSGDAIHTTDVGTNQCYSGHGGTSAAAPLAAGIFALILQIRPDLSWRDLQYLVIQTAVPVRVDEEDWQTTSIGLKFSHTFGYGKIDAWLMAEAARTFEKVGPQAWYFAPWIHVKQEIPQGDKGLFASFEVTDEMIKNANLKRVEHVTVTMNVEHKKRGDISVDLLSPAGIVSHLSSVRQQDSSDKGYNDWTFMSVAHWGETGIGNWTLVVKDTIVNKYDGSLIDWHLKLWGEADDPSKANQLPMPSEHDDDDHDKNAISTITVGASTTSIPLQSTSSTTFEFTHTDHPERPQKPPKPPKPSETEKLGPSPIETTVSEPTSSANTSVSTWLPSFLPTFGASGKTQIWIYGASALILAFCCGLAIYLYQARRKRLRNNPRDEWEFDLLEDEEGEELNGTGTWRAKKGGKRRAGELYDAFAAGSEDGSEDDYADSDQGGDEREKRLYEDDDEDESGKHVIGDDDDDDKTEEKTNTRAEAERLLGKK